MESQGPQRSGCGCQAGGRSAPQGRCRALCIQELLRDARQERCGWERVGGEGSRRPETSVRKKAGCMRVEGVVRQRQAARERASGGLSRGGGPATAAAAGPTRAGEPSNHSAEAPRPFCRALVDSEKPGARKEAEIKERRARAMLAHRSRRSRGCSCQSRRGRRA